MSFNDGAQLDTSGIESGSGGGGRMAIGGGAAILITLIGAYFGVDTSQFTGALNSGSGTQQGSVVDVSRCRTGADANKYVECRVVGTQNSVQKFWAQELPKYGKQYKSAILVQYDGQTRSACGTASNAVGPFYCPTDSKIYIDPSFFEELTSRYGADDGALAQEYVVAHEYGHYIQDSLGLLGAAQSDREGADSGSVRIELMADCFAGMWARSAAQTKDSNGNTFMKPLSQRDIDSALSAAAAVGDDKIQQKSQGQVDPHTWTHGSAEQRQRWFTLGYQQGDLNKCNALNARSL